MFFFQEHFPVRFWYISIIYLTTRCNRLACIAFPYHYILQLLHRIMPLLYYEVTISALRLYLAQIVLYIVL